jgi:hypothetical protein
MCSVYFVPAEHRSGRHGVGDRRQGWRFVIFIAGFHEWSQEELSEIWNFFCRLAGSQEQMGWEGEGEA